MAKFAPDKKDFKIDYDADLLNEFPSKMQDDILLSIEQDKPKSMEPGPYINLDDAGKQKKFSGDIDKFNEDLVKQATKLAEETLLPLVKAEPHKAKLYADVGQKFVEDTLKEHGVNYDDLVKGSPRIEGLVKGFAENILFGLGKKAGDKYAKEQEIFEIPERQRSEGYKKYKGIGEVTGFMSNMVATAMFSNALLMNIGSSIPAAAPAFKFLTGTKGGRLLFGAGKEGLDWAFADGVTKKLQGMDTKDTGKIAREGAFVGAIAETADMLFGKHKIAKFVGGMVLKQMYDAIDTGQIGDDPEAQVNLFVDLLIDSLIMLGTGTPSQLVKKAAFTKQGIRYVDNLENALSPEQIKNLKANQSQVKDLVKHKRNLENTRAQMKAQIKSALSDQAGRKETGASLNVSRMVKQSDELLSQIDDTKKAISNERFAPDDVRYAHFQETGNTWKVHFNKILDDIKAKIGDKEAWWELNEEVIERLKTGMKKVESGEWTSVELLRLIDDMGLSAGDDIKGLLKGVDAIAPKIDDVTGRIGKAEAQVVADAATYIDLQAVQGASTTADRIVRESKIIKRKVASGEVPAKIGADMDLQYFSDVDDILKDLEHGSRSLPETAGRLENTAESLLNRIDRLRKSADKAPGPAATMLNDALNKLEQFITGTKPGQRSLKRAGYDVAINEAGWIDRQINRFKSVVWRNEDEFSNIFDSISDIDLRMGRVKKEVTSMFESLTRGHSQDEIKSFWNAYHKSAELNRVFSAKEFAEAMGVAPAQAGKWNEIYGNIRRGYEIMFDEYIDSVKALEKGEKIKGAARLSDTLTGMRKNTKVFEPATRRPTKWIVNVKDMDGEVWYSQAVANKAEADAVSLAIEDGSILMSKTDADGNLKKVKWDSGRFSTPKGKLLEAGDSSHIKGFEKVIGKAKDLETVYDTFIKRGLSSGTSKEAKEALRGYVDDLKKTLMSKDPNARHLLQKRFVGGLQYEDFMHSIFAHTFTTFEKMNQNHIIALYDDILTSLGKTGATKKLRDDVQQYFMAQLKSKNGVEKALGTIRAVGATFYVGYNVKTMLYNLMSAHFQTLKGLGQMGNRKFSMVRGQVETLKAQKDMAILYPKLLRPFKNGKITEMQLAKGLKKHGFSQDDMKALLTAMGDGSIDTSFTDSMSEFKKTLKGDPNAWKPIEFLTEKGLDPFMFMRHSEVYARGSSFLTFFRLMQEGGAGFDEAYNGARKLVLKSHGLFGKRGRIPLEMGSGGELIKTALNLQHFALNDLVLMSENLKGALKGDNETKSLILTLVNYGLLGGLAGIPFFEGIADVWTESITGSPSTYDEWKVSPEYFKKLIAKGPLAAGVPTGKGRIGIDITPGLKMDIPMAATSMVKGALAGMKGDRDEALKLLGQGIGGTTFGMGIALSKAGGFAFDKEPVRAIEEVSPLQFRRLIKNMREYLSGVQTSQGKWRVTTKGEKIKPDLAAAITQTFGLELERPSTDMDKLSKQIYFGVGKVWERRRDRTVKQMIRLAKHAEEARGAPDIQGKFFDDINDLARDWAEDLQRFEKKFGIRVSRPITKGEIRPFSVERRIVE